MRWRPQFVVPEAIDECVHLLNVVVDRRTVLAHEVGHFAKGHKRHPGGQAGAGRRQFAQERAKVLVSARFEQTALPGRDNAGLHSPVPEALDEVMGQGTLRKILHTMLGSGHAIVVACPKVEQSVWFDRGLTGRLRGTRAYAPEPIGPDRFARYIANGQMVAAQPVLVHRHQRQADHLIATISRAGMDQHEAALVHASGFLGNLVLELDEIVIAPLGADVAQPTSGEGAG